MSAQVWMAKYGALRTTPEAAGNGCAQQTVSVLLEEGCTLCDQGEFDAAQACFRAAVQQCLGALQCGLHACAGDA